MKTVALGEVAQINPAPPKLAPDDEVNFVGMADLDAALAQTQSNSIRRFEEVSKGYTIFADGDILLAKITPCFENNKIGHARLRRKTGVGSTEFHVIRPTEQLDDRYLLHYLRQHTIRQRGELRMTGSAGQRRVPVKFLETLELPLPPLDEQRRIAAILDHTDELRTKRRYIQRMLNDLSLSIFVAMFGDPVANSAEYPRTPLGDLLTGIDSGTSPVCEARPAADDEWAILKLGAVSYGTFNPAENKAFLGDVTSLRQAEVRPGDFLFSRKNTKDLVGATAIVQNTPSRRLLPDLVFRLSFDTRRIDPEYLHALLRHPRKRPQVVALASGSASSMANISQARLRTLDVELPPIRRQHEYANQVRAVRTFAELGQSDLGGLHELFASLQSRAFRGEL